MDLTSNIDRMRDKIRKILILAQDPATGEKEAGNYRQMAAELMVKYGIELAMTQTIDSVASFTPVFKSVFFTNPAASSKKDLYLAIADGLGVQQIKMPNGTYEILGFQSDIDVLEFLFTELLLDGTTELQKADRPSKQNPTRFRISFWMGYSQEVEERLRKANKKIVDETPGSAVVLYDRSQLVDNLFDERHPDVIMRTRRYYLGSGYNQGKAAGSRANLQNTGNVKDNSRKAIAQ